MKLVFLMLSFVAFAVAPAFSQDFVPTDQAISLLTKYEVAARTAMDSDGHRPQDVESQTNLTRSRLATKILQNLKEGMTVSAAFNDVKDRFTGQPQGQRSNAIPMAVVQEIEELIVR